MTAHGFRPSDRPGRSGDPGTRTAGSPSVSGELRRPHGPAERLRRAAEHLTDDATAAASLAAPLAAPLAALLREVAADAAGVQPHDAAEVWHHELAVADVILGDHQ